MTERLDTVKTIADLMGQDLSRIAREATNCTKVAELELVRMKFDAVADGYLEIARGLKFLGDKEIATKLFEAVKAEKVDFVKVYETSHFCLSPVSKLYEG